ncbi:MAG: hypothetical protein ACTJLK_02390 [Anaplasma sp.]
MECLSEVAERGLEEIQQDLLDAAAVLSGILEICGGIRTAVEELDVAECGKGRVVEHLQKIELGVVTVEGLLREGDMPDGRCHAAQ